jgi:hypothetical protein
VDIGRECTFNAAEMELYLYRLLAAEADIYRFVKQVNSSIDLLRFLVEFYDVDAATAVINKYNGFAPLGEVSDPNFDTCYCTNKSHTGLHPSPVSKQEWRWLVTHGERCRAAYPFRPPQLTVGHDVRLQ